MSIRLFTCLNTSDEVGQTLPSRTLESTSSGKCLFVLKILLLLLLHTAIELSLGGSSPYTSTDKTNKIKYINETTQKHSTNSTKHSKYKDTYCQHTHTIVKTPTYTHTHTHPHTHTHTRTHTLHHSTRYTPNAIVTIQTGTLSKRSP